MDCIANLNKRKDSSLLTYFEYLRVCCTVIGPRVTFFCVYTCEVFDGKKLIVGLCDTCQPAGETPFITSSPPPL